MDNYEQITPAAELRGRIAGFQESLRQNGVDGALIVQKTDLYYFAATAQQGWLYVPAAGSPILMIFKEFDRALTESALPDIVSLGSPKKIPDIIRERGYQLPARLGMELDVLPVNLYLQYESIFKDSTIVDVSTAIRLIRAVKSSYEIQLLRQAAACADAVSTKVPDLLREGKTEIELAGELEAYARSLGHQGIVRMRLWGSELFYGHLMAGPAAAVPSYLASPTGGAGVNPMIGQGPGFRKIQKHEPVLVDYVFALNGYLADHARIFAIGTLPDELIRAHAAMLEIQEQVKKLAVPGAISGDIYDHMVASAERLGYGEWFMGVGERRIRFTGHGVGLELDEFPFLAKGQQLPLTAGMIIALEPKAILPGKGVVGIENTHLVTASGLEPLTKMLDEIVILAG